MKITIYTLSDRKALDEVEYDMVRVRSPPLCCHVTCSMDGRIGEVTVVSCFRIAAHLIINEELRVLVLDRPT